MRNGEMCMWRINLVFRFFFHGKICIRKTLRLQTLCHHVASRTHYYRLLSSLAVVVQHRKPHWIIMITTRPWTERPNTHKWSNLCTRNHSHFIFFIRCCLCRLSIAESPCAHQMFYVCFAYRIFTYDFYCFQNWNCVPLDKKHIKPCWQAFLFCRKKIRRNPNEQKKTWTFVYK